MGCMRVIMGIVAAVAMLYSAVVLFIYRPWLAVVLAIAIVVLFGMAFKLEQEHYPSIRRPWSERIAILALGATTIGILALGMHYTPRIGLSGDHRLIIYAAICIGMLDEVWDGARKSRSSRF